MTTVRINVLFLLAAVAEIGGAWGIVVDGFKPTVWDYVGSAVALLGAAIIIFAPLATRID